METVKIRAGGEAMGGPFSVVLRCPEPLQDSCQQWAESAAAEVPRLHRLATSWDPGSALGRLDAAAGQGPVPVPPEVEAMLRTALRVAEATGGAFDPTIEPAWRLWDFRAGRVPTDEELAAALPLVDWRGLVVEDGRAALARPGMRATLGGLAQGWAAGAALARVPGDIEAMADVSGDIAVRGAWRIGIRHPRGGPTDLLAALTVRDAAIVTSGDYERFFVRDGRRYHHVLDPRTGRPATGATSATVVADDPAVADGLSTALMVLGPAGEAAVRALGAWALLVTPEGRIVELGEPRGRVSDFEWRDLRGLEPPASAPAAEEQRGQGGEE